MPAWVNILGLLLSLALSIAAVWYARRSASSADSSAQAAQRSAKAAAETAKVDLESWHAKRQPEVQVRFDLKGSKGYEVPGITLANIGSTDCEIVEVTLLAAAGFRQAIATFTVASGGWVGPWQIPKFQRGDEAFHQVSPPDPHGGRTIVHCICRSSNGEEWTVRLPLDSPGPQPV